MKKFLSSVWALAIFIGASSCTKEQLSSNQKINAIQPEMSVGGDIYIEKFINGPSKAYCAKISVNCLPEITIVVNPSYLEFVSLVGQDGIAVGDYFSGHKWESVFPNYLDPDYDEMISSLASGNYKLLLTGSNGISYFQFVDKTDLESSPLCVIPIIEEC